MNRPDFKEQFFKHPEFILAQMEKQILMKWREAVEEYHLENPLTEEEENKIPEKAKGRLRTAVIYGSTVLAAVLTKDFSYGMILAMVDLLYSEEIKNCIFRSRTKIPMQTTPLPSAIPMRFISLNTGIPQKQ